MKDLLVKISEMLYKWVLEAPGHPAYHSVYDNVQNGNYGMMWTLVFLLIISIAAAAIYYFVISDRIENATKKNYFTILCLGLLSLVIVTVVGLRLISGYNKADFFDSNLIMINLVNLLYFVVFYEIWSVIFMPFSKSTVHLLSK